MGTRGEPHTDTSQKVQKPNSDTAQQTDNRSGSEQPGESKKGTDLTFLWIILAVLVVVAIVVSSWPCLRQKPEGEPDHGFHNYDERYQPRVHRSHRYRSRV